MIRRSKSAEEETDMFGAKRHGKGRNTVEIRGKKTEDKIRSKHYTENAILQYEKLMQEVRMHRHALKNQIGAAANAGISDVKMAEYLDELRLENRYSDLLFCGDEIIAGLLFQKCTEAQTKGISVEFHIYGGIERGNFSQTSVTGMIGVLFDNAIEAESDLAKGERRIEFWLESDGTVGIFRIRNRFSNVSYEQMENWFEKGHSTKGSGRGIGLFYVRELCQKYGGEIGCRNVTADEENFIEFVLRLGEDEYGGKNPKNKAGNERSSEEKPKKKCGRMFLIFFAAMITIAGFLTVWWLGRDWIRHDRGKNGELMQIPDVLYLEWEGYRGKDEKRQTFTEPETDFFRNWGIRLTAVEYISQDRDGNPVLRNRYVRYGENPDMDRENLEQLGQDHPAADEIPFFKRGAENEEFNELDIPQMEIQTYEKDGRNYYSYYMTEDPDGRIVSEFDYLENPNKDAGRANYFYKIYEAGENGEKVFRGYYYAAENLFFLDGYEYEPCVHNNRNNRFRAYAYDGQGRLCIQIELLPYEDNGMLFYYIYNDDNNLITKYEYRILEITGDAFICNFPNGSQVIAVGTFYDELTYEYDGSRHMSTVSGIQEILCKDISGKIVYRYFFEEGYPVKTVLQDGSEIFWEN